MNLVGVSINHRSASVDVRERFHFPPEEISEFISYLKQHLFSEGFILSTCNRTEVFGIPYKEIPEADEVLQRMIEYKSVKELRKEHFELYYSCSAMRHILRVAASIDSMIIGDSQIHGQVREAFLFSEKYDFAGVLLRRFYDTVLKTGKRVISETAIGDGAVTVSYAAVQVAGKVFNDFTTKSALIIGAGESAELAAAHLKDKRTGKIVVTNRTENKAIDLARRVGGSSIPFESFKDSLHNFDIIVSATSSPSVLVSKEDMVKAGKQRRGAAICILDIAVPRDFDPGVGDVDSLFYYDVDSLKGIIDDNLAKRKKEIPRIEEIIIEEMISFYSWYNTLDVVPVIKSFREFFENIREEEVEKLKTKVSEQELKKIDDMTRRLLGRIMHNPTMKLREMAESGVREKEVMQHLATLKYLFQLDSDTIKNNNENQGKDDTL